MVVAFSWVRGDFTEEGLETVCHAYLSDKRGDDIGCFGLGFKSVLGVADAPAVFSRSVSLSFSSRERTGGLSARLRRVYPPTLSCGSRRDSIRMPGSRRTRS